MQKRATGLEKIFIKAKSDKKKKKNWYPKYSKKTHL